jgi:ribosomal protein L22
MLGLVQNAKANAVRASLNTDQMVLSHVQVNIMFPLPRFFLSVCLCCLFGRSVC